MPMRLHPMVGVLVTAAVLFGQPGDREGGREFVNRAEAICTRVPDLQGLAKTVLLSAARQRVGRDPNMRRLKRAVADLNSQTLPAGRDRRDATRIVAAIGDVGEQADRYARSVNALRERRPTDMRAIAGAMGEMELQARRLRARYRDANRTAKRAGMRRCAGMGSVEDLVTSTAQSVDPFDDPRPDQSRLPAPDRLSPGRRAAFARGQTIAAQGGCLACHRIADRGNDGPGVNLTRIGARRSADQLERSLLMPRAPMPAYRNLPEDKLEDLLIFLGSLRG